MRFADRLSKHLVYKHLEGQKKNYNLHTNTVHVQLAFAHDSVRAEFKKNARTLCVLTGHPLLLRQIS